MLRDHVGSVRGVIVKQDLLMAADRLDKDATILDRLRQIVQDANLQRRQLNVTLDELIAELKGPA